MVEAVKRNWKVIAATLAVVLAVAGAYTVIDWIQPLSPDETTLRPEGDGTYHQLKPALSTNYAKVNDESDGTYVYTSSSDTAYYQDLYETEDFPYSDKQIDKVTLYIRVKSDASTPVWSKSKWYFKIKTSSEYEYLAGQPSTTYTNYNHELTTNPNGSDWTIAALDAMEIGEKGKSGSQNVKPPLGTIYKGYCSECYAVVEYSEIPPPPAPEDTCYCWQKKVARTSDGTVHFVSHNATGEVATWSYSYDYESWTRVKLDDNASFPSLDVDVNDNLVFTWQISGETYPCVTARRAVVDKGGSPWVWTLESSVAVSYGDYPAVYVSPDGHWHVGYRWRYISGDTWYPYWSNSTDNGASWTHHSLASGFPANGTVAFSPADPDDDPEDFFLFSASLYKSNVTGVKLTDGSLGSYYNVSHVECYPPSTSQLIYVGAEAFDYYLWAISYSNGSHLWFRKSNTYSLTDLDDPVLVSDNIMSEYDHSLMTYVSGAIRVYYAADIYHSNGDLVYKQSNDHGDTFLDMKFVESNDEGHRYPNCALRDYKGLQDIIWRNGTSVFGVRKKETASNMPLPFKTKYHWAGPASGPMSHSLGRHIWPAAGRYWIAYPNTTLQFSYRSTTGKEWTDPQPFCTKNVANGIYGDAMYLFCENRSGTFYIHYIRSDEEIDQYMYYRRGVCHSNGNITWCAAEQIVESASPAYAVNGVITDVDGYPYVLYDYHCHAEVTSLRLTKSSNNDSGVWSTANGFPQNITDLVSESIEGWMERIDDSNIYVVYNDIDTNHGEPHGRLWNGTLGPDETIYEGGDVGGWADGRAFTLSVWNNTLHYAFWDDNITAGEPVRYFTRDGSYGSWVYEGIIAYKKTPLICACEGRVKVVLMNSSGIFSRTFRNDTWYPLAVEYDGPIGPGGDLDNIDIIRCEGDKGIAFAFMPDFFVRVIYVKLETLTQINTGWTTVYTQAGDIGRSLKNVNASLWSDGIEETYIVYVNSTAHYEFYYQYRYYENVTVCNIADTLRVYSLTEGYWSRKYD